MIRFIKRHEIEQCAVVVQRSFLTVAQEFGFTKENAPQFTAFAVTPEKLNLQYGEGRPMCGYFDGSGQILGYYSLDIQENGECELNNICVLPEYRHKHIGESLFYHALMTAADKGCTKVKIVIVEENKRARAWYEKLGARHIGTEKLEIFPFTCGYMEKTVYSKELFLDLQDYILGGSVFKRTAVRGIIRRNDKYLSVYGKYGDYKFPGGGLKEGEQLRDTLLREVREETGFLVVPESIRGCILVHEKRKGWPDDLLEMDSWYYFCDIEDRQGVQDLDEYEKEYDYRTMWLTLEELVRRNNAVTDYKNIPWVRRETMVMQELLCQNKCPGTIYS